VAAGGTKVRHAKFVQAPSQAGNLSDTVGKVIGIQHLAQPLGDGRQVPSGQAPISGKSLPQDEKVGDILNPGVVVETQETADVDQTVLLGAHGAALRQGEHFPADLLDILVGVTLFPLLDEPGILGKTAGVENEGLSCWPWKPAAPLRCCW